MKSQMKFSTWFKSVASLLVLASFIWLVAGSELLGTYDVVTKVLPDGRYEATESYLGPFGEFESVETANRDEKGLWQGNAEVKVYRTTVADGRIKLSRSGPYVDGCKHGNWTVTDYSEANPAGKSDYFIYDHDRIVGRWKTTSTSVSERSAFEIILAKNSPFLQKLMLFDLTDEEIRTYTDSLEAILSRGDFDSAGFEQKYSDAIYELGDYPDFDSISNVISTLISPDGLYRIKRNELRLAVLQHKRDGSGTTYATVASTYPGYLAYMNANQVPNPEFNGFCQVLDSTMDSYGPLNKDDAFFVDSVDMRLYRALSSIGSNSLFFGSLPALKTNVKTMNIKTVRNEAYRLFKQLKSSNTSTDNVLNLCLADIFLQYSEADIIKAAVKEACFLKRQWAQLPVLTTDYSGSISLTSVTLRGNVIESAGADVSSRGVAWSDTYNPTVDNHVVSSGRGLGIFHVTIDGLVDGKTYYARTFATNRAGTAYGNIVEFTTERVSSADNSRLNAISISVYPNPAFNQATLKYSAELPGNYAITIFNMNGQPVYSWEIWHPTPGIYNAGIDLSSFPGGIYCCRVSNSKRTSVYKFLKSE